ncbi:MAG: hypothetical protein AAF591_20930 [Verrucomicrobiota bacterium]
MTGINPVLAAASRDSYGLGVGPHAAAVNGLAIFLLGLIVGILASVAFLVWHRKRQIRKQPLNDLDSLLEDDSPSQPLLPPSQSPQNQSHEPSPDPWEKSEDWWKKQE